MDKGRLVERLNRAIGLELCAAIQYNQNANMLMGADRRLWHGLFKEMSEGGFEDARKFSSRVTALGGVPNVQPDAVKQASDVQEMLENALDLERRLVEAYTDALDESQDNPAYRNLLEEQVLHEVTDCEELEKYLNIVHKVAAQPGSQRQSRTA